MNILVNLNSYVPPTPIPPVAPNFAFCSPDYGTGLIPDDALKGGGQLPQGTMPVTYSVEVPDIDDLAENISAQESGYHLPFLVFYGGVSISVDVAGPIQIDKISVVPNDIRGMAAYVARQCVGRTGFGGFVTRRIQGLVDFVTNPTSDIEASLYPDSTAFLTLAVTNHENSHTFPGDYDPELARFLWKAELNALNRVEPYHRFVIAERIEMFAQAELKMRRLGTDVTWWGGWLVHGNRTTVTDVQLANMTTENEATVLRRKKVA